MAERVLMQACGQITIPESIREAAQLEENHPMTIELTPDGILLKPIEIDPSQAWFWTPEWQAGEREADEDLAAGRFTRYDSDAEFLAALKARHTRHADT